MTKKAFFNIFYTNIRSLNKNFVYLEAHINKQNYDIVALCETWIVRNSVILFLPGYKYFVTPSISG